MLWHFVAESHETAHSELLVFEMISQIAIVDATQLLKEVVAVMNNLAE